MFCRNSYYLSAPFDYLRRASTTIREELFPISIEIRKRFDQLSQNKNIKSNKKARTMLPNFG